MSLKYECTYEGHMDDMDESYPLNDMNESCHTCGQVMSLKYEYTYEGRMNDVDESCHTCD